MKIISFLFVFFLMLLISCSDNPTELHYTFLTDELDNPLGDFPQDFQLIKLSPEFGKVGREVLISGRAFGLNKDSVKVHFGNSQAQINNMNDTSISVLVPDIPVGDYPITVKIKDSALVFNKDFKVSLINFYAETFTISVKNIICEDKYTIDEDSRSMGRNITTTFDTLVKSFTEDMTPDTLILDGINYTYKNIFYEDVDFTENDIRNIISFEMDESAKRLQNLVVDFRRKRKSTSFNYDETSTSIKSMKLNIGSAEIGIDNDEMIQVVLNREQIDEFLNFFTYQDYRSNDRISTDVSRTHDYTYISTTDSREIFFNIIKKQ